MKRLLLTTVALLCTIAAMAQDNGKFKTIQFDTPAGFKVVDQQEKMLTGKASGIVLTLACVDQPYITEEHLAKTMDKVASSNGYDRLGEEQEIMNQNVTTNFAATQNQSGQALICRIHDTINNRGYIAIITYSEGSLITAEAIAESFREAIED